LDNSLIFCLFLAAFTTYEFRVRAETDLGSGAFSPETQFVTPEAGKDISTFYTLKHCLPVHCNIGIVNRKGRIH